MPWCAVLGSGRSRKSSRKTWRGFRSFVQLANRGHAGGGPCSREAADSWPHSPPAYAFSGGTLQSGGTQSFRGLTRVKAARMAGILLTSEEYSSASISPQSRQGHWEKRPAGRPCRPPPSGGTPDARPRRPRLYQFSADHLWKGNVNHVVRLGARLPEIRSRTDPIGRGAPQSRVLSPWTCPSCSLSWCSRHQCSWSRSWPVQWS